MTAMSVTSTAVFLFLTVLSSSVAQLPPPPPSLSCTDELVLFSPCLPFVAAPPNNLTETASFQCCSIFAASIDTGGGNCLCYLLREPMILGFPLDRSRVLSLSQICNDGSSDESLESLCSSSESPELPPLQSLQFTTPSVSGNGGVSTSSSPSAGLPPEIAVASSESAVQSPPPPPPQSIVPGSLMLSAATKPPTIINFWGLSAMAAFGIYIHIPLLP
ncbi:PREDICTED: uncharacterized protein LOC104808560 [Tarenaya hassleriana]|uniref:uncharacterized protein LOC104808560 n=1 Tax=Tarenaya hassleriana TaxID=28532 RepID=UPI00053C38DF|nr:PREDICTED: uncharacterized protein LOC104808560 [Tarenaya hassleriana]